MKLDWMKPELIKVDKNGTQYILHRACPKCGGNGVIEHYYFNAGGVCFKCDGTGRFDHMEMIRTPEYEKKLFDRRVARERKKNEARNIEWKERMGFKAGFIVFVVVGVNTYNIKDELKAAGAKFNGLIGWYFGSDPGSKYTTVEVDLFPAIEEDYAGALILSNDAEDLVKTVVSAWEIENDDSDYFMTEGAKFEVNAIYEFKTGYDTQYGYTYIHSLRVGKARLVWKTGKLLEYFEDGDTKFYQVGDTVRIKGTVKEHSEYRNKKQTVVTRCKVI